MKQTKNEQKLSREDEMVQRMVERMEEKGELPDRETQPVQWAQEMAMLRAQAREAMMYDSLY